MLIKEIKTICKHAAILFGVMLLVSAFLFIERIFVPTAPGYFDVFFVLFQVGLLFWAFFMGIATFSNENGQEGMDYLLSLPYSRYRLLTLKAVPRIVAVTLMFLLYLGLYHLGGIQVSLMGKTSLLAWYITIFILSFSLSTNSYNFLKLSIHLFVSLSLVAAGLYFLIIYTFRLRAGSDMGIQAMDLFLVDSGNRYLGFVFISLSFLVLPFLVAFIAHFKRFDASYSRESRRRYCKILIPSLVVGVLLSFFTAYRGIKSDYQSYYLTDDFDLIEVDEFEARLYDSGNVRKLTGFTRFGQPFLEDDRYIYEFNLYQNAGDFHSKLMRLDKKNFSVESLYESSPTGIIRYRGWGWKNDIVFLEWAKKDKLNIVCVDRDNHRVRKLSVPWTAEKKRQQPFLFGADEIDGREFFLIQMVAKLERSVLRVWGDGAFEWLDIGSISPLYAGGMLLAPSKGGPLRFWKLNETGAEMVKEVSVDLRFYSYYWQSNLNHAGWKEVCGIMKQELYRVSLDTLAVDLISDSAAYARHAQPADGIYYAEMSAPYMVKSLNRYKNGKNEVLLELNLETIKVGNRLQIFKNGIVLERNGKPRVFAFPDLREITYKKLK